MTSQYTAEAARIPSTEEFPKYLALVDRSRGNAYALRLLESLKVISRKTIDTNETLRPRFSVLLYTASSRICDAAYVRDFYLRLGTSGDEYARRLQGATFSFMIDGDPVFQKTRIGSLPKTEKIKLEDPGEKFSHFLACMIDEETARLSFSEPQTLKVGKGAIDRSQFLGYMIPNGTVFEIELEGVPGGGGLIDLEVGFGLPEYTTSSFKKVREVS